MSLISKTYKDAERLIYRYGRRILGKPVPKKSKPKTAAQPKIASSLEKTPVGECAECRALDHGGETLRIAAFLLEQARRQGVTMWQLPSTRGLRIACNQAPGSAFSVWIRAKAAGAGISVKYKEEGTSPGAYEFNPEEFSAPAVAGMFQLTPKPHCKRGLKYLPNRAVTLEFVDARRDEVIIPRSGLGSRVVSLEEMQKAEITEPSQIQSGWPFPIDLVYTWVDSADDIWRKDFDSVAHEIENYKGVTASTNMARWHSREELRFSIRSVEMYAPWIRKIFVVTNGQVPKWLSQNDRVEVIPHSALYPDPSVLPTFNSNSIETVLHRIDGLSEHFLYMNDDFFFSAPVWPRDFFSIGGATTLFFSTRHYDTRPVRPTDRATVAAHKTTGALLEKKFGIPCKQKFKHAPHAMRVSICEEACKEFADEIVASRKHRFRSHSDIAGPYLFQYYAYLTGRGYSADIKAGYFDTQDGGFLKKVEEGEAKGVKMFCINDSDLADDLVHSRDMMVSNFLHSRFPKPSENERPDPDPVGIDLTEDLEASLRRFGPEPVEAALKGALANNPSSPEGEKLYALLYQQSRFEEAAQLAMQITWATSIPGIKRLDALTKMNTRPHVLSPYVVKDTKRNLTKSLNLIVRCVWDADTFAEFEAILDGVDPTWARDAEILKAVAGAARRAGIASKAVEIFATVLAQTKVPAVAKSDTRRDSQTMKDPVQVLKDLYEIAGEYRNELFLDAGTLLGCIREGGFISYDADIDIGTRNPDVIEKLAARMAEDWRFNLAATRTQDLLVQAKHINGTNLVVLIHKRHDEHWVKRSHVYAWKFTDYELEDHKFYDMTVKVPAPPIAYLEQMYGSEWSIPIAGFDSRLYAPNCFFPDQDEIICTVLNKAIAAAKVRDMKSIMQNKDFLHEQFGFSMPLPKGMQ